MPYPLKYNTASQEIPLGYFLDNTDGNTEEIALTIANTDIKLHKAGATILANKNSGGGTHISNGVYYAVLDATDTNTYGPLTIFVHVAGALAVKLECVVMNALVYDSLYGIDNQQVDIVQCGGATVPAGAIPNAAADAAGGLPISDAGGLALDLQLANTNEITIARMNVLTDWINSGRLDLILDTIAADVVNIDGAAMRGTDNAALASVATEARLAELDAANIPSDIDNMQGLTFDSATDSLEAIRNRGDAAWVTGGGGSNPVLLQNTTIATLASQISFTLTAGSSDNDAYNDAIIVVTDATTSEQKAFGVVSNYVGSTKTITLASDPAIFIMAVGDTVDIVAIPKIIPTTTVNADMRGTDGANTTTPPTSVAIRQEMDTNSVDLNSILTYVDDLETRLTAARAGYLDNLNGHTAQTGDTFAQLPTNFSALSISVGGLVDILQTAADKVWGSTTRTLTSVGSLVSDIWSYSTRALTDKAGFSLSSTGFDLIASTATGVVEIAKAIWDRVLSGATHNINTSAGKRLRQLADVNVIHSGTAQAGSFTSITLASGADSNDNFYSHTWVVITGGTGSGQVRAIHDYNGTTKVATLSTGDTWIVNPDATSQYEVVRGAFTHVGDMSPSVYSAINTEVDAALNTAIPVSPTANSINERIASIDDLSQSGGTGDLAAILTDTANMQPKLGTPAGSDMSADIASVKSDVVGLAGASMRGTDNANTTTPPTVIAIRQEMDTNSVDLNQIAIEVAGLNGEAMRGTDGANTVAPDPAGTAPTAIEIRQEMDTNSTDLNQIITDIAAVKADTASILIDTNELQGDWVNGGRLDLILDAILLDTGTDGVVLTSAERIAIADAILDRDMSTGADSGTTTVRTIRQALRSGRNRIVISGGVMTVYKEDDTTVSWTAAITTTAGNPISGIDPVG